MYLTEIAPVELRGALGSMHQLVVTFAILLSQILGLPYIFGNSSSWTLLLGKFARMKFVYVCNVFLTVNNQVLLSRCGTSE